MGLKTTEYETTAEIRSVDFTAKVPLYFSLITPEEATWTQYEEECAIRTIAVHILRKKEKEIRNQMESQDDYGSN